MPEAGVCSRNGTVIGSRSDRGTDHRDMPHPPVCGRHEDSGVIMRPPSRTGRDWHIRGDIHGTTRLAVDNTVTPTGRGSTMILLGSTKSGSKAVNVRPSCQPGYPSPRRRKLQICYGRLGNQSRCLSQPSSRWARARGRLGCHTCCHSDVPLAPVRDVRHHSSPVT
jgi:hypothetical protein